MPSSCSGPAEVTGLSVPEFEAHLTASVVKTSILTPP